VARLGGPAPRAVSQRLTRRTKSTRQHREHHDLMREDLSEHGAGGRPNATGPAVTGFSHALIHIPPTGCPNLCAFHEKADLVKFTRPLR